MLFKNQKLLLVSLIINLFFIIASSFLIVKKGGLPYIVNKVSLAFNGEGREQKKIRTRTFLSGYRDLKENQFEQMLNLPGEIIFLGDSLTDQGEWAELLNDTKIRNRGIAGDTTEGLLERLDEIVESQPAKIFLAIGTNDIWNEEKNLNKLTENYRQLISSIKNKSPQTKIYIQSILPINNQDFDVKIVTNEKIIAVNQSLRQIAQEFSVTYLDIYDSFLDSEKQLEKNYTSDGVHLTGRGYLFWSSLIKKDVFN
jgi:lysophospholipase L1-like esterase